MRIARIGTMRQPFPPTEYGGTQRSMAQMTVFQAAISGHDVTLYGPADSAIIDLAADISRRLRLSSSVIPDRATIEIETAAGKRGSVRLRTTGYRATGYHNLVEPQRNAELVSLLLADDAAEPYDIIHNHDKRYPIERFIPAGLGYKTLTHSHGNSLANEYRRYPYPVICISRAQARCLKEEFDADVYDVIHHGLDRYSLHETACDAGYLAWLGRFTRKKGAATAIQIARKAKRPLVLAGPMDNLDKASKRYFERKVKPYLDITDFSLLDRISGMTVEHTRQYISAMAETKGCRAPVIFAGPANEAQKQALFGNARATLFPVRWSEPFGRVMIESMACGAPVIGTVRVGSIHCGAVEEVIEDGLTGFHIDAVDDGDEVCKAAEAIKAVSDVERSTVRRVFERDWSSERVARQLDLVFKRFLSERTVARGR